MFDAPLVMNTTIAVDDAINDADEYRRVGAFVILDAARRDNIRKAAQPTTSRWPIHTVRTLVEREGP